MIVKSSNHSFLCFYYGIYNAKKQKQKEFISLRSGMCMFFLACFLFCFCLFVCFLLCFVLFVGLVVCLFVCLFFCFVFSFSKLFFFGGNIGRKVMQF